MAAARTIHLAQFLMHAPTYHSLAMWRHPKTAGAGYDWARPELYQHIARVCERGKLDVVFFADLPFYRDIKDRLARAGRPPESCKILFGVQPIGAASEAEARDKQARHNSLVPLEGGLAMLSGHLDFDGARLPRDAVMATLDEPGIQRMQRVYRDLDGRLLTLEEVARRHGQSVGLPQIVGTADQVADQLEAFADRVGGDGFMLSPIYCPGAIEEFVDLVVPVLQRRGLARREYRGTTVREHLREG